MGAGLNVGALAVTIAVILLGAITFEAYVVYGWVAVIWTAASLFGMGLLYIDWRRY